MDGFFYLRFDPKAPAPAPILSLSHQSSEEADPGADVISLTEKEFNQVYASPLDYGVQNRRLVRLRPAVPKQVSITVSMAQLQIALLNRGLLTVVDDAVAASTDKAIAVLWHRSHSVTYPGSPLIGCLPVLVHMETLFEEASKIAT